VFGTGLRHHEFVTGAVTCVAPYPAVEELAVFPKDVEWPFDSIHHTIKTAV
jgi:hypothetical protein